MSLIRAMGWVSIGTVSYTAAQFVLVMLIAKIRGPGTVGEYGLAQAVAAPLFMVGHLQLRSLLATDTRFDFTLRDGFQLQLLSGGVSMAVLAAIGWGTYPDLLLLLLSVGLFKWAEAASFVAYGVMQRREQMRLVGISMTLRGVIMVPIMAAILLVTGDLICAVLALVSTNLILLLSFDRMALERIGEHPRVFGGVDREALRRLAKIGAPAGGRTGLFSLSTLIPRYVLEAVSGTKVLGMFMVLFQFVQICALANQSIINVIISGMARNFHQSRKIFVRSIFSLAITSLGIGSVAVFIGVAYGENLIHILFGADFVNLAPILPLFLLLAVLRLLLGALAAATIVMRLVKQELVVMVLTLATVTLLSAALIPSFGISGSAWALIGATLLHIICISCLIIVRLSGGRRTADA